MRFQIEVVTGTHGGVWVEPDIEYFGHALAVGFDVHYFAVVQEEFDVALAVGTADAIAVAVGDGEVVEAGGDAG